MTLVLLRGFIFNKWFNISLRVRFITAYFLAACLPLGLLSIGSYGYISEYQHTAVLKNQSRLKLCIGQFDNKKTQAQEEYKKAFLEIQTNYALINALIASSFTPLGVTASSTSRPFHSLHRADTMRGAP